MLKRVLIIVSVATLLVCLPTVPLHAQAPAARAGTWSTAAIGDALNSGDDAKIDQAIAEIRSRLDTQDQKEIPFAFSTYWMPGLITDRRYKEAADMSFEGVMIRPDIATVGKLLKIRPRALLALDKPQEALEAAKMYYNVCKFDQTDAAIDIVCQCLVKLHPEDEGIERRFRAEQIVGSDAAAPTTQAASQPVANNAASAMLKSVHIDAKPLEATLKIWSESTDIDERGHYGNLLLIADRGSDAEKVYRELFKAAATQKELDTATEGIARSLRAEDGTIGRANAWLASLHAQSKDKP